uniref:Uncharacterized protein n=1 Tax=Opuntia streptacantha TaxID=393608 RepID=A0A7C9AZH9_OPUST
MMGMRCLGMNCLQWLCMLDFHPLQGITSATSALLQAHGTGLMTQRSLGFWKQLLLVKMHTFYFIQEKARSGSVICLRNGKQFMGRRTQAPLQNQFWMIWTFLLLQIILTQHFMVVRQQERRILVNVLPSLQVG